MFEWMKSDKHAIAIIKQDHDKVRNLFNEFETTESSAEKEKVMMKAITELKLHTVIEEEIFYPTVRQQVGVEIMDEADEEHHVAKLLIAEFDAPGEDRGHREAKFKVLIENVRHHIKEEETQMLPKAEELEIDFEALGQQMLDRKAEVLEDGLPEDAEHAMVLKARGQGTTSRAKSTSTKKTTGAKKTAARRVPAKTAKA